MTSDPSGAHGDAAAPDRLLVRGRSRWPLRVAALVGLVVFVAATAYVTTHPAELPTSDGVTTASTPAGQPIYLGVFQADAGFDRTLDISGIKVFAVSTVPVTITPHLCRGGPGSEPRSRQPPVFRFPATWQRIRPATHCRHSSGWAP
jgi:hypothetical protein